jgi:hypothetical protein
MAQLSGLDQHCYDLARTIHEMALDGSVTSVSPPAGVEPSSLWAASNWLYLAASITDVHADMLRFDSSVGYCSLADEFEVLRSASLSAAVKATLVFSLTWSALENVVRVIGPAPIPRALKPNTSLVDAAIYYLRLTYGMGAQIPQLDIASAELRDSVSECLGNAKADAWFQLEPHMGLTGVGLHVARRLRNELAHGAASFPWLPDDSAHSTRDARIWSDATRAVLLGIQMLLAASVRDGVVLSGDAVDSDDLDDNTQPIIDELGDFCLTYGGDAQRVLLTLHLTPSLHEST